MPYEKETRPSRQARERESEDNRSLSQREWERKWDEMGPAVIAMAVLLFTFLALGESGVIL